jgi:hypothetical protein
MLRRYELSYVETLDAYVDVFETAIDRVLGDGSQCLKPSFDWDPKQHVGAVASNRVQRSIRVSIGCWYAIQGLSNALMAFSDVAPWFGDPSREVESLESFHSLSNREASLDPIGESRVEAANVLAESALAMLVLHELGHHVLGHLGAGSSEPREDVVEAERLCEFGSDQDGSQSEQWQEVCADRFALSAFTHQLQAHGDAFPGQLLGFGLGRVLRRIGPLAHLVMLLSLPGYDAPAPVGSCPREPVRGFGPEFFWQRRSRPT